MTGKKKLLIGIGVVVILGAIAFANFKFKRVEGVTVNTETIKFRDLEALVSASGKIQPKKWWSVPNGQIHPQKTRPNTSVSARMPTDQRSPRYTVWVERSVIAPTNGSARRKASTGRGRRTRASAEANEPRKAVWKRR